MITGRGPGAPGVTPGPEFTPGRATAGDTGSQAADLDEIRRSEEAINVLAARGAAGPDLTHDPALALLRALAADVDTPGTPAGRRADVLGDLRHARAPHNHTRPARRRPAQSRPAQGRPAPGRHAPGWGAPGWRAPAWPGRAADQRAEAWQALATPSRGAAAWLRAAVAGGVAAALASVTSLIATSMLARLTRGPGRSPIRGPIRGPARGAWRGQRPARPRRMR